MATLFQWLLATAVATSLWIVAPAEAPAVPHECYAYPGPGAACSFACSAGETVSVYGRPDFPGAQVWVRADCGTAHVACRANAACEAHAITSESGLGDCTVILGDSAYCEAE